MTVSKITVVAPQAPKEWQGKTLLKNLLVFENGDTGLHTTFPDQSPPVIGAELNYDKVDNGYGTEIKVTRTGGAGGFKGESPDKTRSIQRQTALKVAAECIDVKAEGVGALIQLAESLYEWIADEGAEPSAIASAIDNGHAQVIDTRQPMGTPFDDVH